MSKLFFVYILASRRNGALYIGVTNDLGRHVWEHRECVAAGFTRKYGVTQLVYFEAFEDMNAAINRELRLRKWKRIWKIALIEKDNPNWMDLFPMIAHA